MRVTPLCARAGVSLVEVMVAMLVFGIAIGAAYRLVTMTGRASRSARDHFAAINIAKSRLEAGKARGYPQAGLLREANTVVDVNGNSLTNGNFRRTTLVGTNTPNAVDLTVVVEIRNGQTRQFSGEAERASLRILKFKDKPR